MALREPDLPVQDLAQRVLDGHRLTEAEGLSILRSPDDALLELLAAAYRVRRHYFGNQVQLNFLVNAKSGHCGEDCGYCSQSCASTAPIPRYPLIDVDQLVRGAAVAAERKAKTYCIATSGRAPVQSEVEGIAEAATEIKRRHNLRLCVSPGFLTAEQARQLKQAGIDRVNHNLNTSERFYPHICTTHRYQDRLNTLEVVRAAGLEICSGGIIGMGETEADVVELALRLGRLEVEASPVNFLQPIAGTPLGAADGAAAASRLTPRYCLKVLVLFRLANPKTELRIAAGREMHLRWLQPLGLYAANSIFVGDYLTTEGQPPDDDYRMLADLGFEPVV